MDRGQTNATAVAHNLQNNRQFALKSVCIGGCLGGGTALAVGGPLAQQLVQAALLSTVISVSLYWLLLTLAAWVSDDGQQRACRPNGVDATEHHPHTASEMTDSVAVAVVGAGAAGVGVGVALSKLDVDVRILELDSRPPWSTGLA